MKDKLHSSRRWIILGGIALLASVAIGVVVILESRPYHFQAVTPGAVYRSGCLGVPALEKVVEDNQIRTVVAVRLKEETDPRPGWLEEEESFCRERGLQFVNIPVAAGSTPTQDQIDEWLGILDDKENLPVLVHCAQGVTRTGMFVSVYEMEFLRKENEEVLNELPMFGHRMDKPRRAGMIDFILNYRPRWMSGDGL